jgi:NAD(P)H-dependent FMN reductase
MPRLLAFSGSARTGSLNKKLIRIAVTAAREAGAAVTELDFRDLPLPLYDGDLEATDGFPDNAHVLKQLMQEHDGFLISCPEYNSSITPLLKNAIDWASRAEEGETPLVAFRGKVAALFAASPGALGGLRGLVHVRAILVNIGVLVLPSQIAVPAAHEAFAADGSLIDGTLAQRVGLIARDAVTTIAKLKAP